MSNMKLKSILTIGNLTIDKIVLPNKGVKYPVIGGPPAYIGAIASRMNFRTYTCSSIGEDYPAQFLATLKEMNIVINLGGSPGVCKETTAFEIVYDANFSRYLKLIRKGCTIDKSQVRQVIEEVRPEIGIISPVINEIKLSEIEHLVKEIKFLGLDMQGFLRDVDDENKIHMKKIDERIISILNDLHLNVLKIADDEAQVLLSHFNKSSRDFTFLSEIFPNVKIIIVSLGDQGVIVLKDQKQIKVPSWHIEQVINPTGAGDVLLGAFMIKYYFSKNLISSIEFACKIAAESVKYFDPIEINSKIII